MREAPDTFLVHTLRKPCARCGGIDGAIQERSGQNCVFCAACSRFQYNAPKTETGQAPRNVTTGHNGITPKRRERILERALGRCELCGTTQSNLHASHVLSVVDGLALGMTELEVNSDDNLMAFCEECNLGMGSESFSPRLYVALVNRRILK